MQRKLSGYHCFWCMVEIHCRSCLWIYHVMCTVEQ